MFHYLLVFEYNTNTKTFKTNKVITLDQEFSVDDWEAQEEIATKENEHKSRLVFFREIVGSRSPIYRGYK